MVGNYEKAAETYRRGLLRPSGKIHATIFNNLAWSQYHANPNEHAELAIEMIKESIATAEPQLRNIDEVQSMLGDVRERLTKFSIGRKTYKPFQRRKQRCRHRAGKYYGHPDPEWSGP